ncbi:MAG: hypothetical protein AAGK04_02065 [Planctomycetota bacterium]
MDERQTQIREGAGLEDSRINEEFKDFLAKWSTPVLLVILLIAAGYVFLQRQRQAAQDRRDAAFASLAAAESPDALIGVANDHASIGAVAEVARLRAGDVYMTAVMSGLKPGAQLTPAGQIENEDDAVTDEDRTFYLEQAASLYEQVWQSSNDDPDRILQAAGAAFGMASVAETRGQRDEAVKWFGSAKTVAEANGMAPLAEIAQQRLDTIELGLTPPVLLAEADLPRSSGNSLQTPQLNLSPQGPVGVDLTPDGQAAPLGPSLDLPPVEFDLSGSGIDPADAPLEPLEDPASGGAPEQPQR